MTANVLYGVAPVELMGTSAERESLTNIEQHTIFYETDTKKFYIYETEIDEPGWLEQ